MGTVASTAALLDLAAEAGGQRAESWTFELTDRYGAVLGTLPVSESSAPRITMDTTRSVFRTCTSLQISAADLSAIDTRKDRVRPSLVLGNGAKLPCGSFMFGNDVRSPRSWGVVWTPELFDEMFILNQAVGVTKSWAPGSMALDIFAELAGDAGVTNVAVGVADKALTTPFTMLAGDLRLEKLNALAAVLTAYPPFYDNAGTLTLKSLPRTGQGADFVYESDTRVLEGFTQITNSAYKAANRYIAASKDTSGAGFVGIYDLPAAAPNSFENTGYRITYVDDSFAGFASKSDADAAALLLSVVDKSSYVQGTFQSTPDPRHDGFALVQLYGFMFQETGFELTCAPGAAMSHTLTEIFL